MEGFTEIQNCRACGSGQLEEIFSMEPMPLAGAFASSLDEALCSPKYPLTWLQCEDCLLVQVKEDIPDEFLYKKYNYASSQIPALRKHFQDYTDFLAERFQGEQIQVLEVGCNDGVLLKRLPPRWIKYGIDPSNVAGESVDSYILIREPFGKNTELNRNFDLLIASNCLAHVSDIGEMIEAMTRTVSPTGEIWIEVHDLSATLEMGQWDTIYHEHKAEFSLYSLAKNFSRFGFEMFYQDKLPLHGGLLRVGFSRGTVPKALEPPTSDFSLLKEEYEKRKDCYSYFQDRKMIAYGASGRAIVWFNQLPEVKIEAVADDSPIRQGKFVPGVGWPILPWDKIPENDTCLITAWNYAEEIRATHPEYKGQWIETW